MERYIYICYGEIHIYTHTVLEYVDLIGGEIHFQCPKNRQSLTIYKSIRSAANAT
jgi:hypothetical protein